MDPYSQGSLGDRAWNTANDNTAEIARLRIVVRSLVEKLAEAGLLSMSELKRYEEVLGQSLSEDAWRKALNVRL